MKLLKKPKQLRFVISPQLFGALPLLYCSSPELCKEKDFAETFNWFLTSMLFYSNGFGSQNNQIDHIPFCVGKSNSLYWKFQMSIGLLKLPCHIIITAIEKITALLGYSTVHTIIMVLSNISDFKYVCIQNEYSL